MFSSPPLSDVHARKSSHPPLLLLRKLGADHLRLPLLADLDEYRSSGVDCPRNSSTVFNITKVPCFGGYSRVLTKAVEIRNKTKNSLFLNAGDEFQGTLFYSFYGGWKIAEAINKLGFSAFTLGNHEFDGGDSPPGE